MSENEELKEHGVLVETAADTEPAKPGSPAATEPGIDTKDAGKETVAAPESGKTEPGKTDTSNPASKDTPTAIEVPSPDTVFRWTDDEGILHEEPFHRIRGAALFKQEYDKWQQTEKQPLEEAKDKYEELLTWADEDPIGFVRDNALHLATKTRTLDFGSLIHQLTEDARAAGLNLTLIDTDTGEEYQPPEPSQDTPSPALRAEQKRREAAERQAFESTLQLRKVSALAPYHGKVTPQIVSRAEEMYRQNFNYFAQQNADNPFAAAIKWAITEATVDNPALAASFAPKPSAATVVTSPQQPVRRSPAAPKSSVEDPLITDLIAKGVLVPA